MKLNRNTSLEPHFYEAAQELVDDIHHSTGSARMIYRARLDGMLTAMHALTGEIWTIEVQLVNARDVICIQNEAGNERVIPSHIDFKEGVLPHEDSDRGTVSPTEASGDSAHTGGYAASCRRVYPSDIPV